MNTLIYDFETLSTKTTNGVVLSLAILSYNEDRLSGFGYTYEGLLAKCKYIKFNVEDQVKNYKRVIDTDTLEWWSKQTPEAIKELDPSDNDQLISTIDDFLREHVDFKQLKKCYTRGNTFDPVFMEYIYKDIGKKEPIPFWAIRDTRSTIDGMSWGANLDNKFIPDGLKEKFIAHDPRHDIVMDVMRMQTLAQAITQ